MGRLKELRKIASMAAMLHDLHAYFEGRRCVRVLLK